MRYRCECAFGWVCVRWQWQGGGVSHVWVCDRVRVCDVGSIQ